MLNLQLVRKYAKAIFEIAQEEGKLVEYGIESVPQAIEFFSNPQVDPKLKKELLQKCFKKELSKDVYHFLLLLVDKHRFVLFPAIVDEYRALSNEARGILIADVTTATAASKKQQKAIADKLEQITGKKVELRLHEDKSLIGGVVVKIGDHRIDGSVAGRLETMKRKLLANE